MKRPSSSAFRLAAEWLGYFESDGSAEGNADFHDCWAVAEWLRAQADAAEERANAADAGVSVKTYRIAANIAREKSGE